MGLFESSSHATEVRRCARCGAASLFCVRAWRHRTLGLDTPGRTFDWECRSCGAKVTLRPRLQIRIERAFAFVMLPAIFPSIYFFLSARKKARAWADNPIVHGATASLPIEREPQRVCRACGGVARCVEIARRDARWLPLGLRYRYVCERCSHGFTVHDGRAAGFTCAIACVLAAAGALIAIVPPGAAVGAEASNRWFGIALLALSALSFAAFAKQARSRRVYPIAK